MKSDLSVLYFKYSVFCVLLKEVFTWPRGSQLRAICVLELGTFLALTAGLGVLLSLLCTGRSQWDLAGCQWCWIGDCGLAQGHEGVLVCPLPEALLLRLPHVSQGISLSSPCMWWEESERNFNSYTSVPIAFCWKQNSVHELPGNLYRTYKPVGLRFWCWSPKSSIWSMSINGLAWAERQKSFPCPIQLLRTWFRVFVVAFSVSGYNHNENSCTKDSFNKIHWL